jgi:microcystin-dependent protein
VLRSPHYPNIEILWLFSIGNVRGIWLNHSGHVFGSFQYDWRPFASIELHSGRAETFTGSAMPTHTHTMPAETLTGTQSTVPAETFTGTPFDPSPPYLKVIFN